MTKGLDYTGRILGSELKRLEYLHVFRYLGDPQSWDKAMTREEVADLKAAGIRIHLNYEQTADFMLGGYSAGRSFALEARKWARWLGFSDNEPILYSADRQLNSSQVNTVRGFMNGAASVDGGKLNVGVYGQYDLLKASIDEGFIGWQTNATAWSNGQVEPRAIAWQKGSVNVSGVDCDLNEMNDNYFQGGTTVSGQIPQSIRDKWPSIAGEFTGSYDDSTAIIWADAAARYAARRADDIMSKLTGMSVGSGLTLSANDIDAIATAVCRKISKDLSAG